MSGVLFLPDVHYDYRIWADLPARLGEEHRIVHFDQGEPLPWAAPEEFLPALGALIRDDKPALVVAAGSAAGFAVHAAIDGAACALLLFAPVPDHFLPEVTIDEPLEEMLAAADPYTPLIEAARESDPARRRQLVTDMVRAVYGGKLTPADLALVSQVTADHAEELLAAIAQVIVAAEADAPAPSPGLAWVDRLSEVTVPVTVVAARRGARIGKAVADRIPAGQLVTVDAHTSLPWLEDRAGADAALRQLLGQD